MPKKEIDRKDQNHINTLVFYGEPEGNFFTEKFLGMECRQWSRGSALDQKELLEDFIRRLSYGEIDDPESAAETLMKGMGWA